MSMIDVWWRWLSWSSGESSRGAVPGKWRSFRTSALDHRGKCVSHLAQQRGPRFGAGDRWFAGHPIAAGVRDHMREDVAFSAIGIVGPRQTIGTD